MAGIVPVAGQDSDFSLAWHESMMPIASDYLAIERAIIECAYAGCKTIWIVCNDDVQPLIRYRLGDYVRDPVWFNRSKYGKYPKNETREIPIFYTPIHPKDRKRRDSLGWSILHGALTAYHISQQISKWLKPARYYVAFPHSVYPPDILRPHRKDISSKRGFFLSYNNKTIRDGEYIGFTFNENDYKNFKKVIRRGTSAHVAGQTFEDGKGPDRLPVEERWSQRDFTLKDIFGEANISESKIIDTEWYYNIDTWDNYCYYIGSEHAKGVKRPSEKILSYNEFNDIGVDNEDTI